MRLYLFVIVVIILFSSCRSLYLGETPIIPAIDSIKKTTASISLGNAQLLVHDESHWMYGIKLDYHKPTYELRDPEVTARSYFLEGGIFGGYNFRNSWEKDAICLFAGTSGGYSIYKEHYQEHDGYHEGNLIFKGNIIQHFITFNAAIKSDNPTTFVPSFSVRFFNFYDYHITTNTSPQGGNYWSDWLPDPRKFAHTYQKYYQFSLTFFRRSGPNRFFVNANYNAGNSLIRRYTTRCGILFAF